MRGLCPRIDKNTSIHELSQDEIKTLHKCFIYDVDNTTVIYARKNRTRCCNGVHWHYRVENDTSVTKVDFFHKNCCTNHNKTNHASNIVNEARQKQLKLLYDERELRRNREDE